MFIQNKFKGKIYGKVYCIFVIAVFTILCFFINISKVEANAATGDQTYSVTISEYNYAYSDWYNNNNFSFIDSVSIETEKEDDAGNIIIESVNQTTYYWTIVNQMYSISYSGQCINGIVSWDQIPIVGGQYVATVSSGNNGTGLTYTYGNGDGEDPIKLFIKIHVEANTEKSLEFIYGGENATVVDYYSFWEWEDTQENKVNPIEDYFEISTSGTNQAMINDISYQISWNQIGITEIINAGTYEFSILPYIKDINDDDDDPSTDTIYCNFCEFSIVAEQQSNIHELIIGKRPINFEEAIFLNDEYLSGSIIPKKIKFYDGDAIASASIYEASDGNDRYNYLLEMSKVVEQRMINGQLQNIVIGGLLQTDINKIFSTEGLANVPFLVYKEIYQKILGENESEDDLEDGFMVIEKTVVELNDQGIPEEVIKKHVYAYSYYMSASGIEDYSISQIDENDQIINDKKIKLRYAINPGMTLLALNYYIVQNVGTEEDPNYQGSVDDLYHELIIDDCAIQPNQFMINVQETSKEYGTNLGDLQYQIIEGGETPEDGNIAITKAGELLGVEINTYDENSSYDENERELQIQILIGRLYDPEYDEETDIDFNGKDSNDDEIKLIQYSRYTPLVNLDDNTNYYFYCKLFEVKYIGDLRSRLENEIGFIYEGTKINFVTTKFTVVPKKLFVPVTLNIETNKVYDGLFQAESSGNDFSNQWVIDKYYSSGTLQENYDGNYIYARVKPVYDTINAGVDKIINVSFELFLNEGVGSNKEYLLKSYEVPDEYQIFGNINKKDINYSFDMTNAIDRPFDDEIFPDQKILIYTKSYYADMPTIKDMIFGNYVYDVDGNIVYEEIYEKTPMQQIALDETGIPILDDFGYPIYENVLDFYGNIVYQNDGDPVLVPKKTDNFLYGDDPLDAEKLPSGFEWENVINWEYYCIQEFYPEGHELAGQLKSIIVTNYILNDSGYYVTRVNQSTPNSVKNTVDKYTPPTGNPGIKIHLNNFNCENYNINACNFNNFAFFKIIKKDPQWEMIANQNVTYLGKQNSNMDEDLKNTNVFAEIIEIDLTSHEEREEIIGEDGLGINFNIIEYGAPNQEKLPISAYEITDYIELIKYAGTYTIEVSLPETTTFKASEPRILYLTIEQAKINIYLSPSERDYLEENPTYEPMDYKENITIKDSWGWRLYNENYKTYYSTLLYKGFVNNESPDNIVFGEFQHCLIDYADIDENTQPGEPTISAKGGYAYNYFFNYSTSFAVFKINKIKAVITLEKDIINVVYNSRINSLILQEYTGDENPLGAFTYSANDNSKVNSLVVGYAKINSGYNFDKHFAYKINSEGNSILDFNPKIVLQNGLWVPYEDGMSGEVYDCTPNSNFINMKYSAEYIVKLYANAIYYKNPDPVFIKVIIDRAETQVTVPEDTVVFQYNGSSLKINGKPSDEEDDNFITNNNEVSKYLTVNFSDRPFDEQGNLIGSINKLAETLYTDETNTQIIGAGYYEAIIRLAYQDGDIINYNISEDQFKIKICVEKGRITLKFASVEGETNWHYTGLPYLVLDPENSEDLEGVGYKATPAVPYSSIRVKIRPVNDEGYVIDQLLDEAVHVGVYEFSIMASGEGTINYDDSEWISQKFEIKKSTVNVSVIGKLISDEDRENYPIELLRYPLEKIYGEDNPINKLQITYQGWVNGEDPENLDNFPQDFEEAQIDWNGIEKYSDCRNYDLCAYGASSNDYCFYYYNAIFKILKKQAEVYINNDYTTLVYTGFDQRNNGHFKCSVDNTTLEEIDFAFSLNYDPNLTNFNVNLIGKLATDNEGNFVIGETGKYLPSNTDNNTFEYVGSNGYVINEDSIGCIDAGTYIFRVSAVESINYKAITNLYFKFVVEKAELEAYIENRSIVYGDFYPSFELYYVGYVGKDIPNVEPHYMINNTNIVTLSYGEQFVENLVHPNLIIPEEAKDAHDYNITIINGNSKNYFINTDDKATLSILRKHITVHSKNLIDKVYDGTDDAEQYIERNEMINGEVYESRHYVFDGVITHYLKEGKDFVDFASFYAKFDSKDAGKNKIVTFEEMSLNNINYILDTISFECEGEIQKLSPRIVLNSETFTYDGTQKLLTPIVRGLPGEIINYKITYKGIDETSYLESENPPVAAGKYAVTVTTKDNNYVNKNSIEIMYIVRAEVNIIFGGDIMQTYGSVEGLTAIARGIGTYETIIPIKYYDQSGQQIYNIKSADSGRYTAVANYEKTANYCYKNSSLDMIINPKESSAIFNNINNYIYDGNMKHQIATFYDIYGIERNALIRYSKILPDNSELPIELEAPKDAGMYIAYAEAPNNNYILTDDLTNIFVINKKDLLIQISNISINEGDSPLFNYRFGGIANGEDINSLDILPVITYFDVITKEFVVGIPTEPGNYRILPSGAVDNNYNINYQEGTLIINAVELVANTSQNSGLILKGSFDPGAELEVNIIPNGKYSKVNDTYEVFKLNNESYKGTNLSDIYEITIENGNIVNGETVTVRLLLDEALRGGSNYKLAHIKGDGSVEIIETQLDGNYLIFQTDSLENFSIIVENDTSDSNYMIYLAIAGAIILILIALLIIKKKA